MTRIFKHLIRIIKHKYWVARYCFQLGLYWQGIVHDWSKFSYTEFSRSIKYWDDTISPLANEKNIHGYSETFLHHRGRNPHHYEYWVHSLDEGGVPAKMPRKYALELVCDYLAAGKSFTIKQLCDMNELSFLEVNAAQITKEGISGNSLSKILSPLVNYSHTPIVVFVDEFDKLFINGNTNSQLANESTASVQNEFLKLLESDTTSVFGDYGKYISVPIDNVLFVFAGAFNNEPHITLDRLRDFGVKTEFLGRVGLIYNTKPLTLEDLYSILECSDLLQNYLDLFFNVNREQVISDLKGYLESSFRNNTLGARTINTLIHQYFIKGGKLETEEVKEITFNKKLEWK